VPTGEPPTPRLNWVEGEDPPELRKKKPWTPQATNNKNFLFTAVERREKFEGRLFVSSFLFFFLFLPKGPINIGAAINAQGAGG
jgi:hypothetical protein